MNNLDIHNYFNDITPLYIFLPDLKCGGAEKLYFDLAEIEEEKGREVTIIIGNDSGDISPPSSLKVINLNRNRVSHCLPDLLKLIPNKKITLLTTMYHCNIICCIVKLFKPQVQLIIRESTSFTFYRNNSSKLKFFLMKILFNVFYNIADVIITPSNHMKELLLKNCKLIKESKTLIKPNPINIKKALELSEEEIPPSLWKRTAQYVFITIGRLDANKNQVGIIKELSKLDLDYELLVLGRGVMEDEINELVKELNLENKVKLLGFQSNVYKFLKASDLFILGSKSEGFPNVLNQAKIFNLKIISTDCETGPREVLENYDKGKLISLGLSDLNKTINEVL